MGRGRRAERAVRNVVAVRLAAGEAGPSTAAKRRLSVVEADLREDVGASVPKASAARILGVSTTTLEKWVDRGILATAAGPSGREEIDAETLTDLAEEVERLRELGQDRALLAGAFHRLAQRDPRIQRSLEQHLHEGLRALKEGQARELDITSFGAED